MNFHFEFDPQKSASNKLKHGIDFIAAQQIWKGAPREYVLGQRSEMRYLVIGKIRAEHWSVVITYVVRRYGSSPCDIPRHKKFNTMNETPKLDGRATTEPPLTAAELEAKFDAGEDVSEYVDWESGVRVKLGEPTPGHKDALLAMLGELSMADKVMLTQMMLDAVSGADLHLNVPIPAGLHLELARAALRRQTTREALVQSWIVQHLEEQRAAA